jgi:chemotaxis family two-component system sensor kinase Cph1
VTTQHVPVPVDLDNCATEPIHIPGSIQPHGVLLAVQEPAMTVTVASANLPDWFATTVADAIGAPLADVVGAGIAEVITLAAGRDWGPRLDELHLPTTPPLTAALHRSGAHLVVEVEAAGDAEEAGQILRETAFAVQSVETVLDIAAVAARRIRQLTGFDRVMVYRFDAEWNGEVVAEERRPDLNTFLGLHYPSTDIPAQARELYRRNWLRLIPDVGYRPVPLQPPVAAGDVQPLDLSHSTLRSVSPIHIEYLSNMGVGASMSVSLITRGELWGLIACHHYSGAHRPGTAARNAAEFIGQIVSARISEAEEAFTRASTIELSAFADRAAQAVATTTTSGLEETLRRHRADVLNLARAEGAVVSASGVATSLGVTPGQDVVAALVAAWPAQQEVFATDHLEAVVGPRLAAVGPAGALGVALSADRREHVIWFRPELLRAVDWGGDPHNAKIARDEGDTVRLSPRKSFEKWQEVVQGRSDPWTVSEVRAAERFARHVSVALSRRQRALAGAAEELQRAMLPAALPAVDGWVLDAYYSPAGVDVVGGDWYDAFQTAAGSVAVVVGDVAGHGMEAAREMAQLRNSLRAYLYDDPEPGRALARLDQLVTGLMPESFATVVCGVVDVGSGTVTLAHAGHPNALVGPGAGVEVVQVPGDPVLGVGLAARRAHQLWLEPGGSLVLYSDGLYERRGEDPRRGMERLRRSVEAVLTAGSGPGVALRVAQAAQREAGGAGDDVTVLVVHRPPLDGGAPGRPPAPGPGGTGS